jgi:hypothetical protein
MSTGYSLTQPCPNPGANCLPRSVPVRSPGRRSVPDDPVRPGKQTPGPAGLVGLTTRTPRRVVFPWDFFLLANKARLRTPKGSVPRSTTWREEAAERRCGIGREDATGTPTVCNQPLRTGRASRRRLFTHLPGVPFRLPHYNSYSMRSRRDMPVSPPSRNARDSVSIERVRRERVNESPVHQV